MSIDANIFRNVLGHYPTGTCVLTGMTDDGSPVGMTVGTFTSVSLNPPIVGFFPDRSSKTWPQLEQSGRFCVNVLAEDQEWLCRRFASKLDSKFKSVAHRLSDAGLPILDDVVAWIDCTLYAVHEAGDHFVVLGQVEALAAGRDAPPLIFWRGGFGQISLAPYLPSNS